jgi:hypothetical protein
MFLTLSPGPISLRTTPVWLTNTTTNERYRFNVLLDDGSDATVISTHAAELLGLTTTVIRRTALRILGFGGQITEHAALTTKLSIASCLSAFKRKIKALVIPTPAGDLRPVDWAAHKHLWPSTACLPFAALAPGGVDMIIGHDNRDFHRGFAERHSQGDGPDARLGLLGWTATGQVFPDQTCLEAHITSSPALHQIHTFLSNKAVILSRQLVINNKEEGHTVALSKDTSLKELLLRSWELDTPRPAKAHTPEDSEILQQLYDTVTLVEGRYQLPCLWRNNEPNFPSNLGQAVRRLDQLLAGKLAKPDTREAYDKVIEGWIARGHLVPVPEGTQDEPHRYLPHFPVYKANNPSKVRPVMDAACKFRGKSLNDALLSGPNLMHDLSQVLVRFRRHSVALTCDITDMFLRIRLPPSDHPFHRMLWRRLDGILLHLMFTCQVFGNKGSPCNAMFVCRYLAEKYADMLPRAAAAVLKASIVDDITTSVPRVEEAVQLVEELVELFSHGDMQIKKWGSSDQAVLAAIPEAHRALAVDMTGLGGDKGVTGHAVTLEPAEG